MKRFDSIITLAFLTGIISLFLGSCTDEKQEMGTMVPLRLSLSSPVILSDSLSTRAAAPTIPFKIAPSTTPGEYAGMAKVYNATEEYPILSFTPATPGDEVMVSRLATSTPLTIYGTAYARDIYYPFYYSGNAPLTEGTVASPLPTKMGNALIFVNTNSSGIANYKVQITALHSPEVQNDECVWDTNGKFPVVKAGSNYPDKFENTDLGNTLGDNSIYNLTGLFASIAPATLENDVPIMTLTEYLVGDFEYQTPLATYTVYTPSAMTFEANKCYFITVNVEQKKAVMTGIQITPMTEIPIEIQAPGIYDLQDLKDFRDAWNANKAEGISNGKYDKWMDKTTNTVNLHADIDLGNEEWTPIGTDETYPFTTITFDGNGHTISNLKVTGITYSGFFGYVKETTVKGLTVKNALLTGSDMSGVITGGLEDGTISNCHVTGTSTISSSVGFASCVGIAGATGYTSPKIESCSVSGATIKAAFASGIAMNLATNATITACSVSDCSMESLYGSSGIASSTDDSSADIISTACIVYNTKLKSSENNVVSPITDRTNTACYYANVTNAGTGAEITTTSNGEIHLSTVEELKSSAIDQKLNEALKAKDPSFPFHFENGEIKEGN